MDIQGRTEIEYLVKVFYDKVKADQFIGGFFNNEHKIDWTLLLNAMTDFWDNAVFYSGNYDGNPMQSHLQIHQHMHMSKAHFDQWNNLFETTIDELFEGENTERLKNSAKSISNVIQDKLFK